MKRKISIVVLVSLVLVSCSNAGKKAEPAVPVSAEQTLMTFLRTLGGKTDAQIADSMKVFYHRHCEDSAMLQLVQDYLYDPNSPLRNEDVYLPFVKEMANSESTPDSLRPFYARQVKMCSLNRRGTNAADFEYVTLDGKRRRLYDIQAQTTLLFFSNPGCEACKEITDALQSSEAFRLAVATGRIAVLNIYIDEDLEEWRKYAVDYPSDWENGYDPNYIIRQDLLYNVRAIPSLYVLDEYKKVILKDAPVEAVFALLSNII